LNADVIVGVKVAAHKPGPPGRGVIAVGISDENGPAEECYFVEGTMEAVVYLLLWAGLISLMMRYGCGAHIMGHGHKHKSSRAL
jgi:hypothetical protein